MTPRLTRFIIILPPFPGVPMHSQGSTSFFSSSSSSQIFGLRSLTLSSAAAAFLASSIFLLLLLLRFSPLQKIQITNILWCLLLVVRWVFPRLVVVFLSVFSEVSCKDLQKKWPGGCSVNGTPAMAPPRAVAVIKTPDVGALRR